MIALTAMICGMLGYSASMRQAPLGTRGDAGIQGLESLALQPEMVFDDRTTLSFEAPKRVSEILAANKTDAELLQSMFDLGFDPEDFGYVRLGTSPVEGHLESSATFPQSPAQMLDGLHDGLLKMANPGRGDIVRVELLLGCTTQIEAPTYASVTLLVGTRLDGSKCLLMGTLGEGSGNRYLDAPKLFIGDWIYEACAEVGGDQGGGSSSCLPEPPLGKKKPKKAVINFTKCFKDCFKNLYPALTPIQLICLAAAAVGCIPSGPGWGICFLAGATVCGLGFAGVGALACGIFCL